MIAYRWPDGPTTPGSTDLKLSFSTASELKAALLSCFVPSEIDFFGRPVAAVPQGRDFDLRPAWGWTKFLLRTRSDWWPALGVAIQHVVKESETYARLALDDMLADDWGELPYTLAILEFLTPLAEGKDDSLAKRIADLEVKWDKQEETGLRLGDQSAVIANEADLERLLREQPDAWRWGLHFGTQVHRWLAGALPSVCERVLGDSATDAAIDAALAALKSSQFDLWRYRALFDRLGSRAAELKRLADEQAATPVVMDLA